MKKRKIGLSDGIKCVLGRWWWGIQVQQVQQIRTNYGIRPAVAKYLTELLFGVLLHPPIAKAQAALNSASKEERLKKATDHSSLQAVGDSNQVSTGLYSRPRLFNRR